jgi:uncharacterized protein
MLSAGQGGPQDLDRARELLEYAVREEIYGASFDLARLLDSDHFSGTSTDIIDTLYRSAGDAGDDRAWLRLAERYAAARKNAFHITTMSEQAAAGLLRRAESGNSSAAHQLALLHGNETLGVFDPARSRYWLSQAARAGNSSAARHFANQLWDDGDFDRATDYYTMAANGGDVGAATRMLQISLGERINPEAASFWGNVADTTNNRHGRFIYGKALLDGDVVAMDRQLGIAMLRAAALDDHPSAATTLGQELLLETDRELYDEGLEWLAKAAENGDAWAALLLARSYLQPGARQSATAARIWLGRSAEFGSSVARAELGRRLLYGDILAADIEEGRSLLQEAADHGDIAAMYTLGKAYADGVVLTKNTTKARQLLSRVDSDNARLLLNSL